MAEEVNRIEIYKDNLNKLLKEEGYFVIFEDSQTKKFVQFFASPKAKQLVLDFPIEPQKLSKEQMVKLNDILDKDFVEFISSEDPIQVSFIDKVNYVAELIERIFIEVFNLPRDYEIGITFDSFT